MIPKHLIFGLLISIASQMAFGQVTTQKLAWNSFDISAKVAPKVKLQLYINERYFAAPLAQHQLVIRTNAQYELKNQWTAYAGYTYFLQSPHDPTETDRLLVPEQRLQQGFTHRQAFGRVAVLQRYQVEQRFMRNVANGDLADGYRFVFRFRYRLLVDIKLRDKDTTTAKGDWVLRIGDEIHLNAGRSIKGQPFDQNRAMVVLQYFINDRLMVNAGYLNWYQQRNGNVGFFNRHIITTGLQAKFDFTKTPKKPKESL
jgi:hypothetical protein